MDKHQSNHSSKMHYRKLAWMITLPFISMYILMYAIVDRLGNVIPNIKSVIHGSPNDLSYSTY